MSTFGDGARRQRLGEALRELRRGANLTGVELAARLGIAQSSVSRMEAGRQLPSPEQVDQWAAATGASTERTTELDHLAEAATTEAVAWRQRPLAAMQQETAALEESSRLIRGYHPVMVHSLLQVPGYARAVYQARAEVYGQSDAEVAKAVAARMAKQELLYTDGHRFEFLVTEAGLRWRFVPREVMAAQLDRLAQVTRMPNVLLGILPLELKAPAWGWVGFAAFLDRADDAEDLVLVETLTAALTVRNPTDLARYDAAFERLRKVAAVGPEAAAILDRIAAEL
jgi:transcriptional regulator with XRE-family HTH domain